MLRRRFLSRSLAVLVATVAAFTVSVSPSSAADAGWATLSRSLYLTGSPTAGSAASMNRSIYLAAGNYSWSSAVLSEGATTASRQIYLAAGWYAWKCTIHAPVAGRYQQTCSLDHGAGPAYLVSDQFRLISGQYTIQSDLFGPY
ncbi:MULTISPECIES: hypothetical protein [Streptomyces]|uniref:Secreted protein n=1 Tax=Streptomyces solicathayae TaxID=3081768 RepID=A0ABZ0LVS9_9ACTN|nr:hypothetical protein [Streptomyces sp. HUAS YS2]WOX23568.1 hypothetical protein R2D22_20140 [Streptomyces sp. HUAS YS2]